MVDDRQTACRIRPTGLRPEGTSALLLGPAAAIRCVARPLVKRRICMCMCVATLAFSHARVNRGSNAHKRHPSVLRNAKYSPSPARTHERGRRIPRPVVCPLALQRCTFVGESAPLHRSEERSQAQEDFVELNLGGFMWPAQSPTPLSKPAGPLMAKHGAVQD